MTRDFNFKKSYVELKINGKQYTIAFSDEAIVKYQTAFNEFHKTHKELEGHEGTAEFIEKAQKLVKDVIDVILGAGSYELLYLESGKSLYNMIDLIIHLSDIIGEKTEEIREKNRKKYVKK